MCTNNAQYEAEAMHFISKLHVPQGYEIDAISIRDAKSLTSGYNEGMRASDAKYKVYLHQDVMIVEPDFIARLLHIFEDPEIGMVGMVGTPHLPENKIPWWAWRVGALYTCNVSAMGMFDYEYPEEAKHGVINTIFRGVTICLTSGISMMYHRVWNLSGMGIRLWFRIWRRRGVFMMMDS